MTQHVQFARTAHGRDVAYREFPSAGGPLILHTCSPPIPIDLLDEDPMYDRFLRTIATAGRLVVYDKPGVGSSDPIDRERDQIEQMNEAYLAVVEAAGETAAWAVGATLVAMATTLRDHPDHMLGLVLVNNVSFDRFKRAAGAAADRDRSATRLDGVPSRANDPVFADWHARSMRLGSNADELAALMTANLSSIREFWFNSEAVASSAPKLLIRRRGSMHDEDVARWQEILPDLEVTTLEGDDAGVFGSDAGTVGEIAAAFINGDSVVPSLDRRLVAVLFWDLVESTSNAAARGDAAWKALLNQYETTLGRVIRRHHGTVVKYTGDGGLATFASGSEAVAASKDLHRATGNLGLEARCGIHVGEIEQRGGDIGGIAVHLAARVMSEAGTGETLATSTVVESTVGGTSRYSSRGAHTLKGIDGNWHLFAVSH